MGPVRSSTGGDDSAIDVRTLVGQPFGVIHRAFREAFADYALDVGSVTEPTLRNRAVKNGVDFRLSAGAFLGDDLVGFTLVGVDRFGGGPAAYDIATGIVPAHRGRRLAGRLLEFILPRLRRRSVDRFVLEVLRQNEPAIRAYRGAGYRVTRRFECFEMRHGALVSRPPDPSIHVACVSRELLARARGWLDWEPSWENTFSSIARIPDDVVTLCARHADTPVGFLVYYPALRWLTTLVVRPGSRRRGVASALLAALVRDGSVQFPLKLNNVWNEDAATIEFLESSGFRHVVGQFEMARPVLRKQPGQR